MNNKLVINTNPKGGVAEAIRTLRTNLQFTFVDNDIKVLEVTSSIPNEGKSFISSNLAVSFSLLNMKVLLIDCDLRKGCQEKIFNLEEEKGLSNLLLDDMKNYKKYIHKTSINKLFVLPKGIIPPNPSELLGSEKNKKLLEKLKAEYDLIILDCPPVNAVADALTLTPFADEVIIVCSMKKTPTDLLINTKKLLENAGAKIAGVVVNNEEKAKDKYYYNEYYK